MHEAPQLGLIHSLCGLEICGWLEAPGPLYFVTLTFSSVLLFLVAYPVVCLLPSAHGPCTNWTTRWYFVTVVGKCNRFWYGGCHGNKNSFASEEECMRVCRNSVVVSPLEHQPSSSTGALQRHSL
uniref:BPTI/Kunitz inhibitor domain-containing protein n=1 Tax=Athene cunicularia TaxID=194338 RepID=A0A663MQX9_ATHCN